MIRFDFLDQAETQKIKSLYRDLCRRYDLLGDKSAQLLRSLVEKGIAYHHAGMLPTLKEVVEQLFTSRLIKVIFTTETFALGINMPARTVVFDELRKYYGRGFDTLKTRDFYQMAGRAGRRGIDKEGYVYSRVNPHRITFEELNDIIYGQPETVQSKFNASYATVLNLYERYEERLYDIYPRSFHYYQTDEKNRKKALGLLRSKVHILRDLGYISGPGLSEKGSFARKIYGYELSLSEFYERGLLEHLSVRELAMLCLALVYEPRKGSLKPKYNKRIKKIEKSTKKVLKGVRRHEKELGIFPLSKRYHFHLSPCLERWMQGKTFEDILKFTDADEGGIIRYFRMAVQILREILDTPASPRLKENVRDAIRIINRDIIDAEKQLRE